MDVEARLELTDSTATLSGELGVGAVSGHGGPTPGNRAAAFMTATRSVVTASTLRVAAINESGQSLDGSLTLSPALVDVDLLELGVDGDLTFHLLGLSRATGRHGRRAASYAAGDVLDASLAGEIVAHFDFVPPPGTHSFDLVVSGSLSALDDTTASLAVIGLDPGFVVDSFGVVEDGTDVLRLVVSGAPAADLAIGLADSPDPVNAGSALTYTLAIANAGPNPATTVTVSHVLPPEVTFASAGGSGWACTVLAGTVTCTRPSVPLGSAPPISVVANAPDFPGMLASSATVSALTFDPEPIDDLAAQTTAVVSPAQVSGTKEVSGNFAPGGYITYTIVLFNNATTAQVDDPDEPEFIDVLPAELTLVDAVADQGTVTTGAGAVRWDGTIPGGGAVFLSIDARIANDALNIPISNQGEIFYDLNGDGSNDTLALTDDPDVAGGSDPTVFDTGGIVDVPTLQGVSMATLILLLAVSALGVLRRRDSAVAD